MNCNYFQLFFIQKGIKGFLGLSQNPKVDLFYWQKKGWDKIVVLTQPLPLVVGQSLMRKSKYWWIKNSEYKTFSEAIKNLNSVIKKNHWPINLIQEEYMDSNFSLSPETLKEAEEILAGRCLLEGEVEWALTQRNYCLAKDWQKVVWLLCLEGKARWQRAINNQCLRCGSIGIGESPCHWKEKMNCQFCPTCLNMGQSRLCSVLYTFNPLERKIITPVSLKLDFPLTLPQRDASEELENFLDTNDKECLLWAVCGAGKTEVAYGAIKKVLAEGERVLIAIPRQEVVKELYHRLKNNFPQTKIALLYGGQKERYQDAQLVLATTHQTIRFYHNFKLVILDEVDAFPYRDNEMLHYAVKRACHPEGKVIYLTATPEKDLLKLPTITIPARHHGFPLPEPKFIKLSSTKGLSKEILTILEESVEKDFCQVFIFLPTIKLTKSIGQYLKDYYQRERGVDWVEYSHSQDREREIKKDRFSRGEFPFFVTTTIMERGVTIPRLNVLVLYSDNEGIFNTSALIQMAGRAGRKKEYPGGRVFFLAQSISSSMKQARKIIQFFNGEAERKNYLIKT